MAPKRQLADINDDIGVVKFLFLSTTVKFLSGVDVYFNNL